MSDKHPPVFFTIAAIRHEPLAALVTYMPAIQDDLRKRGYSGPFESSTISVQQVGDVSFSPPARPTIEQKKFTVFTPDRASAFTFNDEGIFAYHTTTYSTREALFAQFKMGLEVLHAHVQLQTVTRVGIRMLDLVRPSDSGHTMNDYLHPSLLGFRSISCTEEWVPGVSTMEHHFVDGDAEVVAKFDCLPDGFGIHADLFATVKGHVLPAHVTDYPGVFHGILDIDSGTRTHQELERRPFHQETVMAELGSHKDRISQMFRSAVTSLALSEWGLQ